MKYRKRSSRIDQADAELLPRIRAIKAAHPFWGYRRVWSYLRYREQIIIGKNRVYRILTEHDLLVTRQNKLKACRTPERSKPKTTVPNELWGIDMTKVFVESWGWVYLHVVKDWGSKKIVGWQLSARSKTSPPDPRPRTGQAGGSKCASMPSSPTASARPLTAGLHQQQIKQTLAGRSFVLDNGCIYFSADIHPLHGRVLRARSETNLHQLQ